MFSHADCHKNVSTLTHEGTDKLDDRVINVAEQAAGNALENCGMDHNKFFIKTKLISALNGLFVSILDDCSAIREYVEDAIVQLALAIKSTAIVALADARDAVATAPTAWYASRF